MRLKDWKLWLNTFVHIVCIVYATKENPQNMFQLLKKDRKLFVLQALKEQKVIITTVILIISSFDIFKYRYMLRLRCLWLTLKYLTFQSQNLGKTLSAPLQIFSEW